MFAARCNDDDFPIAPDTHDEAEALHAAITHTLEHGHDVTVLDDDGAPRWVVNPYTTPGPEVNVARCT